MSKRKNIILIGIVVLLILAGIGFIYFKMKHQSAEKSSPTASSDQSQTASADNSASQGQTIDPATDQTVSPSDISSDNSSSAANSAGSADSGTDGKISIDPNKTDSQTSGNMFAHITTEHCRAGCQAFANKLDYFEYCQQVCGITPVKNVSKCDGKDGIEKDYCIKDLGITKSDSSICDKINDVNVQKTCKNRIAQDIIEGQTSQPSPE
jgi:hypothetical protein